ncbi:MAG: hypothetical protein AAF628_29500 [Planctomycetota bacterium]
MRHLDPVTPTPRHRVARSLGPWAGLALLLAVSPAPAQGLVPINATYRLAGLSSEFEAPCSSGATPLITYSHGTVTLQPNGTFGGSITDDIVCAGAAPTLSYGETIQGIYSVGADALLTFDLNPAMPGIDTAAGYLRGDTSVVVLGRESAVSVDAFSQIAIAMSSGQSAAALSGAYHVARLVYRNDASGYTQESDIGVASFNGVGGFTEGGTRHAMPLGGAATTAPYAASGSYAVAADGTLTVQGATGALSADGEVFFWGQRNGAAIELTVGVRRGSGHTAPRMAGAWGAADLESGVAAAAGPGGPFLQTARGVLDFAATGSGTGTLNGTLLHVETTQLGTTQQLDPLAEPFTVAPDGKLQLGTPPALPGAVSADGSVIIGAQQSTESCGLLLAVSLCDWPTSYGTATAGTGGVAPRLSGTGGFPRLSSRNSGLRIDGGLGAAPALIMISAAPSVGIPVLGGTTWIDFGTAFVQLLVPLSGTSGMAGAGSADAIIPLPRSTIFAGVSFFAQAFIIDTGAPAGFAMTPGAQVTLCR